MTDRIWQRSMWYCMRSCYFMFTFRVCWFYFLNMKFCGLCQLWLPINWYINLQPLRRLFNQYFERLWWTVTTGYTLVRKLNNRECFCIPYLIIIYIIGYVFLNLRANQAVRKSASTLKPFIFWLILYKSCTSS